MCLSHTIKLRERQEELLDRLTNIEDHRRRHLTSADF